eukprot:6231941-Prymnesium_polylepis.2
MARRCYTNYKQLFNITCGPCDGIAGAYWGDDDDKYFAPDPCTVVGAPDSVPESARVAAAFPPQVAPRAPALASRPLTGRLFGTARQPAHPLALPPPLPSRAVDDDPVGPWRACAVLGRRRRRLRPLGPHDQPGGPRQDALPADHRLDVRPDLGQV